MKFSVLISVYWNDDEELFRKSVRSIKENTLKPNQIVLVIDGKIKNSVQKVINDEKDETFTIIKLKKNVGLAKALNIGLKKCIHELVARCDSDDICFLNRFDKQVKIFSRESNLGLLGGQIIEVGTLKKVTRTVPISPQEIIKFMKFRNPFNHVTTMYRKNLVIELGGYPDVKYREDYALWARLISKNYAFKNMKDSLVYVNAGNSMYKRRGGLHQIGHEIALQKLLLQSKIISAHHFLINIIIRGGSLLLPPSVRAFFYSLYFRNKY